MKILGRLASYIVLSLLGTTLAQASEWRGIRPLYSKRPDVERLLGKADDPSKEHSLVYKTEKEVVIVDYAGGLSCKAGAVWRVPRGTVVSITVSPRTPLPLSELHIDKDRYTKTFDLKLTDVARYTDEEDGVRIVVYQGQVDYIDYFPGKKDEHLRCNKQDELDSKKNIFVYPAMDSYQNLSFDEEKARLDNFAVHLKNQVDMLGYIVVYAGERQSVSKARARARRARNYLVTKHGIEAGRIVAKYGGRREKSTVALAMASPRGTPNSR